MSDQNNSAATESETIQARQEEEDPADSHTGVNGNASTGELPILLIVDRLADRAEPLIEMIKAVGERYADSRTTRVWFRIGMTITAAVTVLVLVSIAAFLTYHDKIEGSTFGFLLGLIIGYMLTFIRDAIGPTSTDEF